MLKPKKLLDLAVFAGPIIFKVLKKYAPQMRQVYQEHPERFKKSMEKVLAIVNARKAETTLANLSKRIEILRENITYLYASAKNPKAAERAIRWRNELAGIQASIPLLDAMGKKNQKNEIKTLNERIDRLSAEIIAANFADEIEDAIIDDGMEYEKKTSAENTEY